MVLRLDFSQNLPPKLHFRCGDYWKPLETKWELPRTIPKRAPRAIRSKTGQGGLGSAQNPRSAGWDFGSGDYSVIICSSPPAWCVAAPTQKDHDSTSDEMFYFSECLFSVKTLISGHSGCHWARTSRKYSSSPAYSPKMSRIDALFAEIQCLKVLLIWSRFRDFKRSQTVRWIISHSSTHD
jgi:hypothetical protein